MATVMKRQELFIGGKWVAGGGDEGESIRNPATGKVIAMVPRGTAEDVERAVAAARKAYDETWVDTTPGERSKMLLELAGAVEENGDELARIESENVGKPLSSTASEEIPFIVDNLRFFAAGAPLLEGRAAGGDMGAYRSFIRREPIGVVASIAPWNYPLMMAAWKIGP